MSAQEDWVAPANPRLASTQELAAAMAALPNPVFVLTALRGADGAVVELTYAFLNDAASRLYGMPVEEVLGHGQLELFPSVRELGIWDAYLGVLESGSPASFDVPWFQESGVEGSFRLAVSRLGDGLLVLANDITDQLRAVGDGLTYPRRDGAEPHLAERRLRAAYDSMLDPHVLYEAIRDESGEVVDFRFVDANPAACEYNRWDQERLIGSTLLEQWPDFAGDPAREAYAHVLATGDPLMLDDVAWAQERLFGGQIRHYDVRAVRVSDSLLSVTWRDITAQAQARRELAGQQAAERKRLEELEQFKRLTVGRELKMIELKKEIEYLKKSGTTSGSDPGER